MAYNPDADISPGGKGPSFPISTRRVLEKLSEGIAPDLADLDMVTQGVVTAVQGPSGTPANTLTATLQGSTAGVTMRALVTYHPAVGEVIWVMNLGGAWIALGPVTVTDLGWIAPTLQNSWVNLNTAAFNSAGYMREGKKVYLRGVVNGGVITAGTVIFNVPAAYRPFRQQIMIGDAFDPAGKWDCRVGTNGDIWIQTGGGAGNWLSFDNMMYWLD